MNMTIEQFNKRYEKETIGYKDRATNEIHYCPHDLGFKFTQDDCLETSKCSKCWDEAIDYMKFKSEERRKNEN